MKFSRPTLFSAGMIGLALMAAQASAQDSGACNNVDSSARAIIEHYLGPDVPDFSLYNTTKANRATVSQALEDALLEVIAGLDSGGGEPDMSPITDLIVDYAMSLVGYVAPGLLAFLFALFAGTPILFVRLCCARKCCAPHHPLWGQENGTIKDYPPPKCCGCSRKDPPDAKPDDAIIRPYTYWEQCSPVFFYILFAAFMTSVCISGTLAVGTILSGLDGSVCAVDTLIGDAQNFTNGLAGAMGDMLDTGVEKLDEVADIIAGASAVSGDAGAVATIGEDAVAGIDALISDTASGYNFDSAAVSSALSALSSASATLDSTFSDVDSLIVGPRGVILGIADQLEGITNQTDGFFAAANDALYNAPIEIPEIPMLTDGQPLSGFIGVMGLLEQNAIVLGSPFFILAILSVPFTVFGILVMGPKCAHKQHPNKSKTMWQCCGLLFSRLSCCSLHITIIIACIPALLLFPVSAVVTDVCVVLESFGEDHTPYIDALLGALGLVDETSSGGGVTTTPSASYVFEFDAATGVQTAIDTCFSGGNLLDALNITTTLYEFVGAVDFSAIDDLDPAAIVDIDAITSDIAELTDNADIFQILSPFDAADLAKLTGACDSCADMGGAAAALNNVPFYTGDDYSTQAALCTSCGFAPCDSIQTVMCNITSRIASFNTSLAAVKSDFDAVNTGLQNLYDDIVLLKTDLTNAAAEITTFALSVYTLGDYANCGFIKEFYDATITALCPGSTAGMLWLGYSLNILCLSAICVIVCIILINCRLGGVGQPNHHSDPKNFAPGRVGKFFDGSHDSGQSSAKVAPHSHESTGMELTSMESADAQAYLDKQKEADNANGTGDQAGVAV